MSMSGKHCHTFRGFSGLTILSEKYMPSQGIELIRTATIETPVAHEEWVAVLKQAPVPLLVVYRSLQLIDAPTFTVFPSQKNDSVSNAD